MARWYEAVNQASFKPTADGYVFQSPNPWIFGKPRHYLVNEEQKAAILPLLGRWRLLLLLAVLAEALLLGAFIVFLKIAPATFVRVLAPLFQFGVAVFAVGMFMLVLALLIMPLILLPQIYLNRSLAPLLAKATPTSERVVIGDQLPRIAGSASGWVLALGLFGGICMMLASIVSIAEAYGEGKQNGEILWRAVPLFAIGGLMTSYFIYLFRLRVRLKRAAAAKIDVNRASHKS